MQQEEIIADLRKNDYNLPHPERQHYQDLIQDSLQRLGLETFVPWNQVSLVVAVAS